MQTKSDDTLIRDMADAMLRYGEGCTRDQLAMHFTQAEIDRFSERARQRANEKAVHQRRTRVAARSA